MMARLSLSCKVFAPFWYQPILLFAQGQGCMTTSWRHFTSSISHDLLFLKLLAVYNKLFRKRWFIVFFLISCCFGRSQLACFDIGHYEILGRWEWGSEESGDPASQLENSITDFQRMKSMLHTALHVLFQSITAKSGSGGLSVSVVLRLGRSEQGDHRFWGQPDSKGEKKSIHRDLLKLMIYDTHFTGQETEVLRSMTWGKTLPGLVDHRSLGYIFPHSSVLTVVREDGRLPVMRDAFWHLVSNIGYNSRISLEGYGSISKRTPHQHPTCQIALLFQCLSETSPCFSIFSVLPDLWPHH